MQETVLARLQEDHARFERLFKSIEEECTRIESEGPAELGRLKTIVGYLATHALPRHHAFEDALFAQIVIHLPHLSLDIFDLVEDHQIGRREFRIFAKAVESGSGEIVEAARSYVAHERAHFISEEELVFPYAARYLTDAQWNVLRDNKHAPRADTGSFGDSEAIADLLA